MSKATLSFTDCDDGGVKVEIIFDPPIKNSDDSIATPAQYSAMRAIELFQQDQAEPSEVEVA